MWGSRHAVFVVRQAPCRNVDLSGWQAASNIPACPSYTPPTPLSLWAMSPPTAHLCLSLTPNHPQHLPTEGRDFGIPAVTQELPPLLSAFFSSRSESWTSLGPNPSGRLYGSHCFHEIGISSIFLTQETQLKHNIMTCSARSSLHHDMQYIYLKQSYFPFAKCESLKCSSTTCCPPPFSKYLCWDISGEGTSAELMQCVRSRASLLLLHSSPAGRHPQPTSGQALCCCRPPPNTFHHILTQYDLLLNWRTDWLIHNSIFLTDKSHALFVPRTFFFFFLVTQQSKFIESLAQTKRLVAAVYEAAWNTTDVHFSSWEKIIILGWSSIQNPQFQHFPLRKAWTLHMHSAEHFSCPSHSQDVWRL